MTLTHKSCPWCGLAMERMYSRWVCRCGHKEEAVRLPDYECGACGGVLQFTVGKHAPGTWAWRGWVCTECGEEYDE